MSKQREIAKTEQVQVHASSSSRPAQPSRGTVYQVTNRIRHNGKGYESGDLIELCEQDAARLIRFSCITEV